MGKIKLFSTLCALILIAICSIGIASCDRKINPVDQGDSIWVAEQLSEFTNPTCTSVDEVLVTQDLMKEKDQNILLFKSMPQETLKDVATVLINRNGKTSLNEIVDEYVANNSVYDNLSKSDNTTSIIDDDPSEISENVSKDKNNIDSLNSHHSYTTKDTIINGKRGKAITKTEIRYE